MLLEVTLALGNFMNGGRGGVSGFKLDTLLKVILNLLLQQEVLQVQKLFKKIRLPEKYIFELHQNQTDFLSRFILS